MTRIFAFDGSSPLLRQSEGGFSDYVRHFGGVPGAGEAVMSAREVRNEASDGGAAGKGSSRDTWKKDRPKKRLSYMEQREYDTIESEIGQLEERIAGLDRKILEAASDFVKLQALTGEREEADALLEAKMERFLELQDMVDSFA